MNMLVNNTDQNQVKSIAECSATVRTTTLNALTKDNYDQSVIMTDANKRKEYVTSKLLTVARGVFIEYFLKLDKTTSFMNLDLVGRREIGAKVFTKFHYELKQAQKRFEMGSGIDSEELKLNKTFDGGNWSNVISKLKTVLQSGYDIALVDEHGAWEDSTLQAVQTSKKAMEDKETERQELKLAEEAETERLTTASGQFKTRKELMIGRFVDIVDSLGNGLNADQALKMLNHVERELASKEFFASIMKTSISAGLVKTDVMKQVIASNNAKRLDFDRKVEASKAPIVPIVDDIVDDLIDIVDELIDNVTDEVSDH